MPAALVSLLLIVWFSVTAIKDFQTNTPLGLFRGIVGLLIAVAFIYGQVTEF